MGQSTALYDLPDYTARYEVIKKAESYDAVSQVYHSPILTLKQDKTPYSIIMCSDSMRKLYPKLSRGEWFETDVNEDGSINIVVDTISFRGSQVGDTIEMHFPDTEEAVVFRICGFIRYPAFIPLFTNQSNMVSTDTFFQQTGCIIAGYGAWAENAIASHMDSISVSANFIVEFEPNAEAKSVEELKAYLQQAGGYTEMSSILEYTQTDMTENAKTTLMLPVFFLVIASFGFLSISVLNIYKKISTRATYYIVGCSKKNHISYILMQIGAISFLSAGLNLLFAYKFDYIVSVTGYTFVDIMIDSRVVLLLMLIVLTVFALTSLVCILIVRRKSPIELIREYDK